MGDCDKKLSLLLKYVGELEDKKATCDDKLSELESLLAESRQQANDPPLQKQVAAVEKEASGISKELAVQRGEIRQLQ